MKLTNLIVKRSELGVGYLYDSSTCKLCIMGHVGLACGVPKEMMKDVATPQELGMEQARLFPDWAVGVVLEKEDEILFDKSLTNILMEANDYNHLDDIVELLKEVGVDVQFVD